MRWPFRKTEKRAADYGAALSQAFYDLASGSQLDAARTAAGEFSIGLWGRAFALAEVDGVTIPAPTLAAIGRNLALRGNAVFDVQVDPVGGLVLLPATTWDIFGGPDPITWEYRLNLAGPSTFQEVSRLGSNVIHCRINELPETPWAGRSPLTAAGYSAKLASTIEKRASEEAGARVGTLLQTPALSVPSLAALKADLAALLGGVALVENAGGNFPRMTTGGQQADWRISRFGAAFPEGNVALRRDAAADVVSAFGIPSSLYSGQEGASVREGWRQFGVAAQALGAIVSAELSDKLERPVSLNFRKLASIDIAARARAVGILAGAGVALEEALDSADLSGE